jgi:hypothetical protein
MDAQTFFTANGYRNLVRYIAELSPHAYYKLCLVVKWFSAEACSSEGRARWQAHFCETVYRAVIARASSRYSMAELADLNDEELTDSDNAIPREMTMIAPVSLLQSEQRLRSTNLLNGASDIVDLSAYHTRRLPFKQAITIYRPMRGIIQKVPFLTKLTDRDLFGLGLSLSEQGSSTQLLPWKNGPIDTEHTIEMNICVQHLPYRTIHLYASLGIIWKSIAWQTKEPLCKYRVEQEIDLPDSAGPVDLATCEQIITQHKEYINGGLHGKNIYIGRNELEKYPDICFYENGSKTGQAQTAFISDEVVYLCFYTYRKNTINLSLPVILYYLPDGRAIRPSGDEDEDPEFQLDNVAYGFRRENAELLRTADLTELGSKLQPFVEYIRVDGMLQCRVFRENGPLIYCIQYNDPLPNDIDWQFLEMTSTVFRADGSIALRRRLLDNGIMEHKTYGANGSTLPNEEAGITRHFFIDASHLSGRCRLFRGTQVWTGTFARDLIIGSFTIHDGAELVYQREFDINDHQRLLNKLTQSQIARLGPLFHPFFSIGLEKFDIDVMSHIYNIINTSEWGDSDGSFENDYWRQEPELPSVELFNTVASDRELAMLELRNPRDVDDVEDGSGDEMDEEISNEEDEGIDENSADL